MDLQHFREKDRVGARRILSKIPWKRLEGKPKIYGILAKILSQVQNLEILG